MIDEARDCIPGGVQHNLAFNYPFPLVFTKAEGIFLEDLDGHRYYDFLQAGGPTVLGSNPPEVREKVIGLLETCGPSTGLFHEYEYRLARLVTELIPSVDFLRMLNSGTEACMASIRVARLASRHRQHSEDGRRVSWMELRSAGIAAFASPEQVDAGHGVLHFIFKKASTSFSPAIWMASKSKLRLNTLRGGTAWS